MENFREKLQKLDDNKLIDVVKNYRQYGYDADLRKTAISILEERGLSEEQLELTGRLDNHTYDLANDLFQAFKKNSKLAFVFYISFLFASVLVPLTRDVETWGALVSGIRIALGVLFLIFLVRSFMAQGQFHKVVDKDLRTEGAFFYFLLGIPLYIIMYFYFLNRMKEKKEEIR